MNTRTRNAPRTFVVPASNLVFRLELELRKANEDIAHTLDLEYYLGLFITVAVDKNAPGLVERVVDFETDLMMYDIDRPEAEALFRKLLRRVKVYLETVTGQTLHNFNHWHWHNREHRAVVLVERF